MNQNQEEKSVSVVSADDVRSDAKELHYWPYCHVCRHPFEFDKEEPFAYCQCGTTEWGNPRPASWIPDPGAKVKRHNWSVVTKSPSGQDVNSILVTNREMAAMLAIASTSEGSDSAWPSYRPIVEVSCLYFDEKVYLYTHGQMTEVCILLKNTEYRVDDIGNTSVEFSKGVQLFIEEVMEKLKGKPDGNI